MMREEERKRKEEEFNKWKVCLFVICDRICSRLSNLESASNHKIS